MCLLCCLRLNDFSYALNMHSVCVYTISVRLCFYCSYLRIWGSYLFCMVVVCFYIFKNDRFKRFAYDLLMFSRVYIMFVRVDITLYFALFVHVVWFMIFICVCVYVVRICLWAWRMFLILFSYVCVKVSLWFVYAFCQVLNDCPRRLYDVRMFCIRWSYEFIFIRSY